MPCPSELACFVLSGLTSISRVWYRQELAVDEHALNARETAFFENLLVGDSVLPSGVADPAQAALMKLFELLNVAAIWGPCSCHCMQYSSALRNTARHTAIFVWSLTPRSCQSLCVSLPKALLGFAMRWVTSPSRDPLLLRLMPR